MLHILYDHQSDLKRYGILKIPQVQVCALLYFIQTVHKSISMYIQLSGRLGDIQIVLKKLINRRLCLIVDLLRRILP